MLIASVERSTGPVASLALTYGFLIRGTLLVVRGTRLATEMSITFRAGDSDGREGAQGARHTITAGLVTAVCGASSARCYMLYKRTSSPWHPSGLRSYVNVFRDRRVS